MSWLSVVAAGGGPSLVAVHRFLIAVAPLVAEHERWARRLQLLQPWALEHRLSSCGGRA